MSNTKIIKNTVAGVGMINVDLVFSGLKRLPEAGEELFAGDFSVRLGGGVPSSLYAAKRFGADIKFAGYLGESFFSDFILKELAAKEIPFINLMKGAGSGINVTAVMPVGNERTFVTRSEPCNADSEAVYAALSGSAVVIAERGKYLDVYRELKKEGSVIVGDFGYDENMNIREYRDTLEVLDYYFPNEREAKLLTLAESAEEALKRLSDIVPYPVITLAERGAMYLKNGVSVTVSAEKATCIDATGAGDAFLGGYSAGIAKGLDPEQCLQQALRAGTHIIRTPGCY